MDNFKEYMWYLLTSPFKQLKQSINAWWAWCQVIGSMFDEVKEDFERARDEGMVAACSRDMLAEHGADRGLTRYIGEDAEGFRRRIAMYEEVCVLGGLNEGVLLAVRSLGFEQPEIVRAADYAGNPERWAEFYLILPINPDAVFPVSFDILKKQVRKVKASEALDNYVYLILLHNVNTHSIADRGRYIVKASNRTNEIQNDRMLVRCIACTEASPSKVQFNLKNNLWYLNGQFCLNGSKKLNAYETWEEL